MNATAVILAAGEGTRMRSSTPKLLHELCGRPMIAWPVAAARASGVSRIVVVADPSRRLEAALAEIGTPGPDPAAGVQAGGAGRPAGPGELALAVQAEPRGTADAVKAAASELAGAQIVLVLAGDVPLVRPETLSGLAEAHVAARAGATLATVVLDDPTGYGRVVRGPDGSVERVVETKVRGDATSEELAIREVNTSIYAFDGPLLLDALEQVRADNAQEEYYLTDVVAILRARGERVAAHLLAGSEEALGVNDRVALAAVRALAQRRIHELHMYAGVTIVDPDSTVIDVDVEIGQDAVIAPFSSLHGATRVGPGAVIGPLSTLYETIVGARARVVHSYTQGALIGEHVSVGPFAYLRPGTVLGEGAKAGTFVEIKNSEVGSGAKVPHLSYIGDTDIGEGTNIGAGTITANYDGTQKNRTTIGAGAFVGVDTMLVAPVAVGDRAYTAAGSVITKDVPPGALGVARARQETIPGYTERRRQRAEAAREASAGPSAGSPSPGPGGGD